MHKIKVIQVYGTDCPSCKKLFEQTEEAIKQLNLDIKAEYISDIQKIIDMGMMTSPLLVIDGEILLSGQLPGVDKLKEIINSHKDMDEDKDECCGNCSCGHGNCC